MKRFLFPTFLALSFYGSAIAGPLTGNVEFTGGENSLASFVLTQDSDSDGLLTLHVSINQAKNIKGCVFALQYDPLKYEFIESHKVQDNLFDTSGSQSTLFFANDKRGQVFVGAMKIDGSAVSGDGVLAKFMFRTSEIPRLSDFQIVDGIMVDLSGNTDAIFAIKTNFVTPDKLEYALNQNMPNPFNPSTMIKYQLPESGDVKIVVYNLLGQEVRTLVHEYMDAGYHSIVWDGMDKLGKQVASGIYIYRLSVADFVQSRRMMLLK